MRTGTSSILSLGRRGRRRLDARLREGRRARLRWLEAEPLEDRTLLATTPAPAANGAIQNLSGLSSVSGSAGGNANSPIVAVDPYNPQHLFAVWGEDLSTRSPAPHTTAVVMGAYSTNGGASWAGVGTSVAPAQFDPLLYGSTTNPPTYTQVLDPSMGFDANGNVYVLTLQTNGSAGDGELYLSKFHFSTGGLTYPGGVYQWTTGADAATSPVVAVDAAPASGTAQPDPYSGNVYIAWASIDVEPANPNPYNATGFNPDRAELVVGTPIASPGINQAALAFSGVKTVNTSGNASSQRDSHPQLVINQNTGGQVTVAWDDFGSGSTASPPVDDLMSNLAQPGNAYGFTSTEDGKAINPATSTPTPTWTEPSLATAGSGIYYAGPAGLNSDPTSIAVADLDKTGGNDIVVADGGASVQSVGVLLNQGGGAFPAPPGNASTYSAGFSPMGVALGAITGYGTSIDAVAANDTAAGGVSLLTNAGNGTFGTTFAHLAAPWERGTVAVAVANLDGSGTNSIVAVDEQSNTVTIFPDGSAANPIELTTGLSSPVAVIVQTLRANSGPDILVLNSNGTIQAFLNPDAGVGNFGFTAGASISVPGAVGMAIGAIYAAGEADLVVAYNIGGSNGNGGAEVLQNTSTAAAVAFGAPVVIVGGLPGPAIGVATGNLSGNTTNLSDVAVLYSNNGNNTSNTPTGSPIPVGESMVAVLTNQTASGTVAFARSAGPQSSAANPNPEDWDAGVTNPTAIAVANVSGGAIQDIIVASAEGRGYVSVMKGSIQASGAPRTTDLSIPVSIDPTQLASLDNLTVKLDLVDQSAVSNLEVDLIAPNGAGSITLVRSQYNTVGGTAITTRGLPGGNSIGVYGFTTGATGVPGVSVGTIFDDNATRDIFDPTNANPTANGNAAPYIGFFRPEVGSLAAFLRSLGTANINGTWTLELRNYAVAVTGVANQGLVNDVSVQFSTGLTASTPHTIASTQVVGALGNAFPRTIPASPDGAGPGLVLAVDNTLGAQSPHQGRIYAAYVGYVNAKDVPTGHVNPTTNTDIYLSYSDNGGASWFGAGMVNDDNANADGFSGSAIAADTQYTQGRTQFQPAVAVDQATGTLVISWRDARNDAANARVATYLTTSIDGGASFSPQSYANPTQSATDAITGKGVVMGPEGDNQSPGNPQTDGTFGYGDQMGLAVFDGQVYPVWAGNLNLSYVSNGAVLADPLNILYRPMVIAAGPRILDGLSTMGPISYATAASGSVTIDVTFDRPIIASTFVKEDVTVLFRGTTPGVGPISMPVLGVSPIGTPSGAGLYTTFMIVFSTAPAAAYGYTGTYSYLVAPDNGAGLQIAAPVRSYIGTTLRTSDPMDQNADGTPDENAVAGAFTGTTGPAIGTPGDVYAVPMPQPPGQQQFSGAASILSPPFNPNGLPIIVPGPQVLGTSVPGGNPAAGNLVTDGTVSQLVVSFDRPMLVNTNPAGQPPVAHSFSGDKVLQIMGPTGSVVGPQNFAATGGSTLQKIRAATDATTPSVLDSTLSVPSYGGTFRIAHIAVSLTAAFSPDSDLTVSLIAPDGTAVPLFSGIGGSGSGFVNTVLDDAASTPISGGTAPFTGQYQPMGPLSALVGKAVDAQNAFGQWVPGVWTLRVVNPDTGQTGVLDNWSLQITPAIADPVPTPQSEVTINGATYATQFAINFPRQQLSGTYTAQLSPDIVDPLGEGLDTNRNAGLAVLRGQDQAAPTTTVHYGATDLPGLIGQSVSSVITVPDDFMVLGDQTTSKVSGMQVQLSLSYANDPDLTATLTHIAPDGVTVEGTMTLFGQPPVGKGVSTANFNSTIFDDNGGTPIQQGVAPFFSTYAPQESLATAFAGWKAAGTWVLTITNASATGMTGKLTDWSLTFQKALLGASTGLAEPGSDDVSAGFRIFSLGQADALSSRQWTAVGPAAIGGGASGNAGDPAGRVSGLAIDPSDASGNTVYAAGASGGIWKTTDFLTTDPAGPTWIPLTDFGPTSGVNVGGIAIFPRNNDPNQSIIIAATGEGDTGSPGVGFLISGDGGATWNLADSTNNVDANGNFLPINSANRDRKFVGNSSFAVVVDPKPTPGGGVIVYAAMSGTNGGVWRSVDTGRTWTLLKAGPATSVVLDQDSGNALDPDTNTFIPGNLQRVYAAFRGDGIYMSPNQGQIWTPMPGGIGNPLIFNSEIVNPTNINPVNGPTPNGGQGRITLAVPKATGNLAQDDAYEGWLYALVSTTGGTLDGIFVTKDFGQNWTEVHIPTEPNQGYITTPSIPTNDVGLGDYSVLGNTLYPQGNYNQTMAVDPTNPSVIYVGGTADGNQAGLVRIDLTTIWDAHALVTTSAAANDGGKVSLSSTGPATIGSISLPLPGESYLNFIRNPLDPFVGSASIYVYNINQFTNDGSGVSWIPFDVGGTDYHRMVTMVDPVTGLPRLVFGNDQGIWSVLDSHGAFEGSIGGTDPLPGNSRIGNLQITQFYYGAAQPSNAAALIAGSLFYGSAQDNGGPHSAGGILSGGDLVWNGADGDAGGVAVDQQGNGTLYQYWWPCCGGNYTDFFQVNGVGRTYGLLQQSNGDPTPDPQWPFGGGANFAVNPVSGQDIVISSAVGRVFATTNQGVNWFDIGDPGIFNNPGGFDLALAYGAPDPTAPAGVGNLGNFIYVGTIKGQIYVTQNGGGGGTGGGNNWYNVSTGLDGSAVQQIITDPTRGSHDAYAVTSAGVYYIANSVPSAGNPTPTWVNITGALKTLAYSIFGQAYDPTTDSRPYDLAVDFTSIAADWRYAIPNKAGDPTKGYHPVLYVGADSGVFQSLDQGKTWSLFPDTNYGAVAAGGDLPHASVTSLGLSLGNISPQSGMPALAGPYNPNVISFKGALSNNGQGFGVITGIAKTAGLLVGDYVFTTSGYLPGGVTITSIDAVNGAVTLSAGALQAGANLSFTTLQQADPDLLSASTYGRGTFAINLAPMVVGNAVAVDGEDAATAFTGTQPAVNGTITFTGTSEVTNFGNTTWITVEDVTDPTNPVVVAGFDPGQPLPAPDSTKNTTDALGHFAIPFDPEAFYGIHTTGVRTYQIFATDNAGSVGNKVTVSFYLNPPSAVQFAAAGEPPATATAGANFAAAPPAGAGTGPVVVDVVDARGDVINFNGPVTLQVANSPTAVFVGTLTVTTVNGVATFNNLAIQTASPIPAGSSTPTPYIIQATSPNLTAGNATGITILPDVAGRVFWTAQPPQVATEDVPFTATVEVEDQYGNLETSAAQDVVVTLLDPGGNPDPADLGGQTTITTTGGVAVFTLKIHNIGNPFTLVASSGTLQGATSTGIDVVPPVLVPGIVSTQGVSSQGAGLTETAGASFPTTWTALTNTGAVDTYFNGQVTLSIYTGPTGAPFAPGAVTTATAVNGVATFYPVILDVAGQYDLRATSGNLTPGDTNVTIVPDVAVGLYVSQQPQSIAAGAGFALKVQAQDRFGNPTTLAGSTSVTVAIASGPAGGALGGTLTAAASPSTGIATFNGLTLNKTTPVGTPYVLRATATGFTATTTQGIVVTAAGVNKLVIPAGGQPPASVQAGQAFPLTVYVEDQFGNIVTGYNGPLTIAAPGVLQGTSQNANQGQLTFQNLAITKAGTYQIQVNYSGTVTVTATSVTVTPDPTAAILAWSAQPSSQVVHGSPFPAAILVEDRYGNPEANYSGTVTMAIGTNPAGGTLGGTATASVSPTGLASFPALTIDRIGDGYTLVAALTGGPSSSPSNPIDVTPIQPSQLAVATPPPGTVPVGQSFGLTINVLDQSGNVDTEFNGPVTIDLAGVPLPGVLLGSGTFYAGAGVVNVTGLELTSLGTYTLQVSSPTLASVNTGGIQAIAGPAAKVAVTTQPPSSVTAGDTFGLVVQAEDQFGNPASDFNGILTATLWTGAGAPIGVPAQATAVDGVATFSNLDEIRAGLGYTVRISGTGIADGSTDPFAVAPGPVTQLVLSQAPPPSVTAGAPFSLRVSAADAYGNPSTAYNGPVALRLATAPGGGGLGGTVVATATNGTATFPALSLVVATPGYTIQATGNGLMPVTSAPISVGPGAPSKLVIQVPPPSVVVAGAQFGLGVVVEDAYGNPVGPGQFTGSVTVGLSADPGGAPLVGGPFTVPVVGGVANFPASALSLQVAGAGYGLQATSPGLSPSAPAAVTVVAGSATHLAVVTQPPSVVLVGNGFGLAVAAEDAYGNVDTTYTGLVTVAAPAGSGASLGGSGTVPAVGGVATFGGLVLAGANVPVSLPVTSPGLAGTATSPVTETTPAVLGFSVASINVAEDAGVATIQVVRSGGYEGAVSVQVATTGGTAVAGTHYQPIVQTINFAAGQDSQTITIPILNAGNLTTSPTVVLSLSGPGANATLGSQASATVHILNAAGGGGTSSPVALGSVQVVTQRHKLQEIVLTFSGGLDAAEAMNLAEYSLVQMGRHHSFTGKGARAIALGSATYDPTTHTVRLTTKRRFAIRKPLRLLVHGGASGLADGQGRPLAGNPTAVITRQGTTVSSARSGGSVAVDQLAVLGELAGLGKARKS